MKKIFFALLLFVSCKEELIYPDMVSVYVNEFKEEAVKRGVKLHYNDIKFILAGKNKYNYGAYYLSGEIVIDTTSGVWKDFPQETVTHELGHALLGRTHDFGKLPNGMYRSVMGNNANYETSGWTRNNTDYRKKYYYDELFDSNTPYPDWAKNE